MSYKTSHLVQPGKPWILWSVIDPDDPGLVDRVLGEAGITAGILCGARARTSQDLMGEFASRLDFPDYFGRNWDALADCLTDLSWLHGIAYAIVIKQARYLLDNEPESALDLFMHLLEDVSEWWAESIRIDEDWNRPEIPFHILLCESPEYSSALQIRIRSVGVQISEFRCE